MLVWDDRGSGVWPYSIGQGGGRQALVTYVVGQPGFVKLGRTDDIHRRMRALQAGNPIRLELRAWIAGDHELDFRVRLRCAGILPIHHYIFGHGEDAIRITGTRYSEWYVDDQKLRGSMRYQFPGWLVEEARADQSTEVSVLEPLA